MFSSQMVARSYIEAAWDMAQLALPDRLTFGRGGMLPEFKSAASFRFAPLPQSPRLPFNAECRHNRDGSLVSSAIGS